jgi:hypothetical protein
MSGDIMVTGTPSAPRFDGEIQVSDGEFKLPGARARFTRTWGAVTFSPSRSFPTQTPTVSLQSEGDYRDASGQYHLITFTVSGSWSRAEWDLYTSSGLNKGQTFALLFSGRTPTELRKSLLRTPTGPVAFLNVKLFDADAKAFLSEQTVLVENGRIMKVGPAKAIKLPHGTLAINGAGKTLIPGLWDSHAHIAGDFAGLQELSMGVTSLRDPGNDDSLTIDRRTRAAKGDLLMPNVYPSSLIDGR